MDTVFFPRYEPEDYGLYRGGLRQGRVRLDRHVEEQVGLRPDWNERPGRSVFFMFNLHSLRWVYDLIRPGASGDLRALADAGELLRHWDASNPIGRPGNRFAWGDEHAVSWRAVTLAWFFRVWSASELASGGTREQWLRMGRQHGGEMCRPSNYRPYHNHGANNALGLLALAVGFRGALPEAERWLALGLARAEQQMRDNVSPAGTHLEQSSFYHCYVLRTFLEVQRVADDLGRPMSRSFLAGLDRMLAMAARMAGNRALYHCFPYSDPDKDPLREWPLLGETSVPRGLDGDGAQRFRRALAQPGARELAIDEVGGYAIFNGPPHEPSVVFHVRILDMPHGHQDALGVYACHRGRQILALPSTMHMGDPQEVWPDYFAGPRGHNTVVVDDRPQRPASARRRGPLAAFVESHRVRAFVKRRGLADLFTTFRARVGLDPLAPLARSTPRGGEVLGSAVGPGLDWVAARHGCYPDVVHERTVVRLGHHYLLVRDRVEGTFDRVAQRWHLAPGLEFQPTGTGGTIREGEATLASVQQLTPGVALTVALGQREPELAGWFADNPREPKPCVTLSYSGRSSPAEFLWVARFGEGAFDARREGPGLRIEGPEGVTVVRRLDPAVEVAPNPVG